MKMTTDKALTRLKIYDILLGMKRAGLDGMTEMELDGMLLHFAPKPGRVAKTGMQWLAKAVAGKKGVREPLRFIYCDGHHAYASDGHRAHRIPAGCFLPGYYCPKMLLPVGNITCGPYPEAWRVFETAAKEPHSKTVLADCETVVAGKQVNYVLSRTGQISANKKYIDDAANGDKETMLLESGGRISGQSEFGEFVVMGLRT